MSTFINFSYLRSTFPTENSILKLALQTYFSLDIQDSKAIKISKERATFSEILKYVISFEPTTPESVSTYGVFLCTCISVYIYINVSFVLVIINNTLYLGYNYSSNLPLINK